MRVRHCARRSASGAVARPGARARDRDTVAANRSIRRSRAIGGDHRPHSTDRAGPSLGPEQIPRSDPRADGRGGDPQLHSPRSRHADQHPPSVSWVPRSANRSARDRRQTFQSLNEMLKHSLSWHGLMWRWEAWRTGTSFAAIVLKHTLVYRVEHVFLIHRHTGQLISHVAAPDAVRQDPQLVSSMLAAIQDFIRDSFSSAEHQGFDTVRLGDSACGRSLAHLASLAVVIHGNPLETLHETLAGVVTRVTARHHDVLSGFQRRQRGACECRSDSCGMCGASAAGRRARRPTARVGPSRMLVLALLGLLGWWEYPRWQDRRHWDEYASPSCAPEAGGREVAETGTEDGKWSVSGLRRSSGRRPASPAATSSSLDPARVVGRWTSCQLGAGVRAQSV